MKKTLSVIVFILVVAFVANAQITLPASGPNKSASVSEKIGITDVKIEYNRPAVNGREGKIWGNLVHYGFADLHYGTSKAAPWRAGADENTTITFSTEVKVEGKSLPAGKYGFFIAMGKDTAILVFSNFNTAWGSFYYDEKDDALRVEVPVLPLKESVERLKYEFDDQTANSAVVSLQWEKVKIPFEVSVDLQKEQIAAFRREFNSGMFYRYWQNMHTAASYCLENDINLEEGLSWAERSLYSYFGEVNFLTLSTYAGLLAKLDNQAKADSVMEKAYPMATMQQLDLYGRSLHRQKRNKDAYKVFEMNYMKYPDEVRAQIGMIQGHASIGNVNEALKQAEKIIANSTNPNLTNYLERLINEVKAGRDISNM